MSFAALRTERRWFSRRMYRKWDVAGPNSLVLPTVGAYTNSSRVEGSSSIDETCRTIPIALDKCK